LRTCFKSNVGKDKSVNWGKVVDLILEFQQNVPFDITHFGQESIAEDLEKVLVQLHYELTLSHTDCIKVELECQVCILRESVCIARWIVLHLSSSFLYVQCLSNKLTNKEWFLARRPEESDIIKTAL